MRTYSYSVTGLSSLLLPRLIGLSHAKALLLTGATVQPNSPHIQGLYHDVLPTREEVFPASLSFAKELAANTSQVSIAYAKGLLHHPGNTVEETFLLESRALAEASKGRDAEELTHAFFERRRPNLKDTVSKNMPEWYPWVSSNHACKRPLVVADDISGRVSTSNLGSERY